MSFTTFGTGLVFNKIKNLTNADSPFTITNEFAIYFDATITLPYTVYLPTNPIEGQLFYIKDINGLAQDNLEIIIDGNGNLIEGASTFEFNKPYSGSFFSQDGSNWILPNYIEPNDLLLKNLNFSFVELTSAASVDIDWSLSNIFFLEMAQNTTFTFSNIPTDYKSVTLYLKQDSVGSRTISFPASVNQGGAGTPIITTTANRLDIIVLNNIPFNYQYPSLGINNKIYGVYVGGDYTL